jgi:hypothetical protein
VGWNFAFVFAYTVVREIGGGEGVALVAQTFCPHISSVQASIVALHHEKKTSESLRRVNEGTQFMSSGGSKLTKCRSVCRSGGGSMACYTNVVEAFAPCNAATVFLMHVGGGRLDRTSRT